MSGWRTLLGLPLWAAQLVTGAKSFRDNPLIGSERLNRMGLHGARVRLAHRVTRQRRARLATHVSAEHREAFEREGYVAIENYLPPEQFAELRERVLALRCEAREMVQGDTITRRIALNAALLASVPALRALIQREDWRGLMRYVSSFASEPLYYVQTILSQRIDAPPDPQTNLHADTFHPTLKAWYFLNDVGDDEGPLTYVPGSHRLTPARLAWEQAMSIKGAAAMDRLSSRGSFRIDESELAGLGLPRPHRFAVPANTLVVVDTHGFHARARSAKASTRVELWGFARRNPFLPWTGGDLSSMAWIAPRRIDLMWRARDLLRRWVGQPWRPVGAKSPTED